MCEDIGASSMLRLIRRVVVLTNDQDVVNLRFELGVESSAEGNRRNQSWLCCNSTCSTHEAAKKVGSRVRGSRKTQVRSRGKVRGYPRPDRGFPKTPDLQVRSRSWV